MSSNPLNEKEIFDIARAIESPDARDAYIRQICGNDEALSERINALLEGFAKQESFLEEPAADVLATDIRPLTEQPGDVIGPYKLLQQIGEGGMGTVFMAEQTEPVERRVALKIIKPGMDTQQVIARFEAERQALAMMDHPNIAKVHDAGTTDTGRPYFVMELVKGIPVTKYCDQEHLTVKERLDLFLPICQAIQHAHQKGIIHRDVKPTNILVARYDGKPVPKVIDFGVAKATSHRLTEKTMFTHYGQIVGTIEYMSPEQAEFNQLDIDTRSDIYSLGVLLYELLTGETPFDKQRLRSAAFDELLRIIREEEPPRPSTKLSSSETLPTTAVNRKVEPNKLSLLVRGELDWIVMKALEKDRNRRYETATSFANDIQHYLNDEAVEACPPSAAYKFRKFARRNKVIIGTTTAIAASLIAGIITTSWQAYRATKAEGLARQEAERATKAEGIAEKRLTIVESQKVEIEQEKQNAVAEAERADREALRANEEAEKAKTEAAIAKAVNDFLNADLLGMTEVESQVEADLTPNPNITLRAVLDRAAESIEGRFEDQPLVEAAIRHTIANAYLSLGAYDEAERHSERALELRKQHLGAEHAATLASMNNLAISLKEQGRYQKAEKLHLDTLDIERRLLGPEHPDTLASMNNLATVYWGQGRYDEAEELHRKTLEIQQRVLGAEHISTLNSMGNLAISLRRQDRNKEAEELLCETLKIWRRVLGPEHPVTLNNMNNLAASLLFQKRYREAEKLLRETLEILRRVRGPQHPATLMSMMNVGLTLLEQGSYQEAEKLLRETLEIKQNVLGLEHPATLTNMYNLAKTLLRQGRHQETEELSRKTLEIQQRVLGAEHPNTLSNMGILALSVRGQGRYAEAEKLHRETLDIERRVLGLEHASTLISINNLGTLLAKQRRYHEAEEFHREALEIRQRVLGAEDPETLVSMNNLAFSLRGQGRYLEAEKLLREMLKIQRRVWRPEHPDTLSSTNNLAATLETRGRYSEAEKLYREAYQVSKRTLEEHDRARKLYRKNFVRILSKEAWKLASAPDHSERNPQRAVEYAKERVSLEPESPDAWETYGVALCSSGQYQEAVDAIEKAKTLGDSGDGSHLIVWAMACWKLGSHQEAIDHFIQAAKWGLRHPFNVEQYALREEAIELFRGEELDGIKLTIETLSRQINEETNALRRIRANLYAEQGAWNEAAADFAILLDKLPDSRNWSSARIRVCRELASWPEVFDRLASSRPDDTSLWIGRAQERVMQSQWKEALAAYARAAPVSRSDGLTFEHAALLALLDDWDRYTKLCQSLLTDTKTEGAKAVYAKARTACLSPHSGVKPEQLVEWAKQSVDENRYPWYLHVLGLAHYRAGQLDEAIDILHESNNGNWLRTAKAQNHLVLAMAHYSAGRHPEAREWLQRAQTMIREVELSQYQRVAQLAPPDWIALTVLRREAEALLDSDNHPQPLVAPRPRNTQKSNKVLVAEPAE